MRRTMLVVVGAGIILALAGTIFVRGITGDEGRPLDAADWAAQIAVLVVFALPGVLALVWRRQPATVAAAGLLALLLSPLTYFVLAVPALLLLLGIVGSAPRRSWVAAVAAFALGAGAASVFFGLTEPFCWEYEVQHDGTTISREVSEQEAMGASVLGGELVEAGGGCTDRTTPLGAVLVFVLAGAALATPRLTS